MIALQLAALNWRLEREAAMSERGGTTWLPMAEWLNLAALVIVVFGVFVLPIGGFASARIPRALLGLSLILFVGHAFALIGHYELFTRGRTPEARGWLPRQEIVAIALTLLAAMAFLIMALPARN